MWIGLFISIKPYRKPECSGGLKWSRAVEALRTSQDFGEGEDGCLLAVAYDSSNHTGISYVFPCERQPIDKYSTYCILFLKN